MDKVVVFLVRHPVLLHPNIFITYLSPYSTYVQYTNQEDIKNI